jgi:hypothetical protein
MSMNKTIDVPVLWKHTYKFVKNCDLIDICTLPAVGPVINILILNFGLPKIP